MNFVGKFDGKLPADGPLPHSHVHVEHPSTHAPADAIIVPDAHLLFGADFKRSGVDLILSNADRELVVHDYFKGEHRVPLASPDGAHLTGDIVNALTGQVEYAQADGSAAVAHVIGHVTKLMGSATAIRNGVSIILNQGDNVEKGDVVATGSDSTLGVTFIDGTVFGLSSNARMVLNEMVYDPNGSNNSSLISLVAGTISFVAGETAKHGDMKVDTPVATMGIRGTAVLVEIDFNVPGQNGLPDAKFQVLVEPDGSTGSYILFDKTTLDPIATVNKAGQQVNINQNGVSYTNSPLTPELQKLISDVFTQKFSNTDTNTKLVEHFTDSIVPPTFQSITGPNTVFIQTVFIPTNTLGNGPSQTQGPTINKGHVDVAPTVGATNAGSVELAGVTGSTKFDTASGFITFQDVNLGDQPTASTIFKSFVYQNALQQDISNKLTPTEQAAVHAVEIALNVTQDPLGQANGTAIWTYSISDDALDFLGAGETLTLTYLATVSNNFAQSIKTTTVPITVTITGSNDVPKIDSAVPQTIAFQGGTNVPGGDLTAHVPTSGTIMFDDPDLTDTHTVSAPTLATVTLTSPNGTPTPYVLPPTPQALFGSALTASLATDSTGTGHGSIDWSLAKLPVWLGDFVPLNDILTLTYVVTVTDSQGKSDTQDITVTITGTDTPAVVWIATTGTGPAPDGLWSNGANWETGSAPTSSDDVIIITDQLEGLTPTYPVTITSAVGINGAVANSLTMDNFGGAAPVLINQDTLAISTTFDINDHSTGNPPGYTGPEFDNHGAATVGGAFNMNADAIVNNSGSLTVDGKMEVLDQSSLQNSGTIKLAGGGDFSGQSTVSNTITGALIEVSGGTLNVSVDISNLGTIKVDPSSALTLSAATIEGGTVTNNGTLTLDGAAVLKNGILGNSSQIKASGSGNALDNETVTNTGGIEIVALGALTLDLLTTVGNAGHTITVDGTGTLTLQGAASVTGGSLANSGTVDIEGTGATLDGVAVTGSGAVNVDAPVPATLTTLVLKDTTSFTNGTLTVGLTGILSDAGSVTLDHVGVTNKNSIEVTAGNALTLDNATTVDNTSGTITVDGTGKLTLNGASINGGTINDFTAGPSGSIVAGDIDVTGSSTISNAHLNNGHVTLGGNVTLTLDGSTVTGTSFDDTASGAVIQVDGGDTLTLNGASINGGTINDFTAGPSGSTIAGDIDITGSSTISNAGLNNGNVTLGGNVTLNLDGTTITGTSFDDTASGAVIQVDGGDTLTLKGASINGGTINGFTAGPSGSIVAGDIDVTGSSTISNAHLNNGNVTLGSNVTLTLTDDTVAGANFTDAATGATIQIVGDTILDDVTISGGTVTNTFNNVGTTITIDAGQTLKLQDGATVSGGTINNSGTLDIEKSTGATLDGVTIIGGGAIQVDPAIQVTTTPLVLEGGTSITGGTLTVGATSGSLVVETGAGATLDHVGVTNDKSIEVFAGGNLRLDDGTTVDNGSGTLTVDGGATLTLNDAEITGGTVNDFSANGSGTIDVTDSSTISNATLNNGNVTLGSNVTLNLDGTTVTGTSFDDTASGATIQIDGNETLTLNGADINGGIINDFTAGPSGSIIAGDIDVTGSSTISNAHLHNGNVTIGGNVTLTLDGSTVTGTSFDDTASGATIQVDGNDTLTLNGASINGGIIDDFSAGPSGSIVAGDIDITGSSTISNAALNNGNVTLGGNVTLNLDGTTVTGTSFDDTASGATIQVDGNDTLTLNDASINGGTINDFTAGPSGSIIAGDIDVTGSSTISNAALNNGNVTLSSNVTLTLTNDKVTGTSFADTADGATIQIVGNTTLDDVTVSGGAVTNATITVDGGETLTLQDGVTVSGGTLNNFGTLDIEGTSATLDGVTVTGGGAVNVDVATQLTTLVLEGATSITAGTLTVGSAGILSAAGSVTLDKVGVTNQHSIEVTAGNALTLDDGTSVDNTAGIITVDGTGTLTLNDAGINGGTINNFSTDTSGNVIAGDIDVTGSSTISNAALNQGNVTVGNGVTLTLDGSTVTGASFDDTATGATIQIDGGEASTLTLSGARINGGTINDFSAGPSGSIVAGDIDVTGSSTISNAALNHGTVTLGSNVTLTLDGSTVTGTSFDDTASGATIQVDGNDTLTLNDASINGGIINDFSAGPSGSIVAGDIDVTGASTISNADLNNGNVTLGGNVTLNLDGSTVTGTSFDDTASGATIQVDGNDTLTLNHASINGGTINDFTAGPSGSIVAGDIDVTGSSTISNADLNHGNVTLGSNVTLTLDGTTVNGTSFDDTASGAVIQIDGAAGDTVTLSGANITGGGITVAAHGLVQTNGNVTLANTGITNDGTIEVTGGTLTITGSGSVADSHGNTGGTIQIDGGAVLDLNESDTQNVSFSGTGGELKIDTTSFSGNISGLAAGDEIDLSIIGYGPGTTATYVSNADNTGGTLNVTDGQHSIALQLVGDYSGAHFAGSSDSAGDTLITLNAIDDTPTITATGGSLAEAANVTNSGATDTASGTVTFSDVDLTDRPTVTTSFASFDYKDAAGVDLTQTLTQAQQDAVTALEKALTLSAESGNTNNGTVDWSYSVTDSALDFMAAGDKLILTYNATVNDGTRDSGSTATTQFNVTITGSDDAPTVGFAPAHLQFDGHSAAVGPVATTNIGNGTDGVTLDGWVNWNGVGDTSHGQILFYNGNTSTAGFGMFSVPTAGGSLDLEILAGGETLIDTGIKLTAGQWYNVALSHVNDIFTLDVDGAVVYTSGPQGAFAMGHLNSPDFTLIGGNSGGTEGFNGGIADVSVWNTALSQSQVQAIEFGTLSGTEPGLAAYYPLNDGSGTTATDAVNSAGNLSFVGNPAWQTSGGWPDSSVSTAENHAITINGISVNDVDAGNSQIEVTLAAGHGSLSLANSAGLDSVHTNSDGSINLFGSQAAIDTALSHGVIYTPVTDFSGADTITVTANDQVSAALGGPLTGTGQIAVNVEPGTPTFSSMTLGIAQGGTDVLTDANFSISDPDTSHFLYSVNNVTGGQFEVFNGTNWVSAPTGGFTTAQIEAGHVEFVQDGTDTAPGFSITAADGTNVSAPISPTVNFTPTPPVAHDDVLSGPSGSGWVLDTDNGHYYREVTTLGSFEAAVSGAAADGGYLATITSAAEQSFVVNHVINGFSATWLGGETNNDRPDGNTVNESIWSWVTGPETGTQFSYTNWNPGEPSGGFNATTQWLQIGSTGGWNDAPDAGQPGDGAGAGYLEEWGGTPTQITSLENTGTSIDTSVLLANDTDVNGLTLTVTAVGDTNGHSEHGGTVSLNGNVITYTPSTDYSGADSFSYTITDGSGTSTATVSFDVQPGTPDFTGMTLTIAQGGTEVLSDANFSIADSLTSHFLYTVNDVTGGQFEVFNGTNWVDAPTGGFTTQQIEAGHVEFVQDGSATAPSFSITAADGTSVSAAISPTVDFIQPHALAPANLIVNGGFETNDFSGWTIGGVVATPDSVVVGPSEFSFSNDAPHTGSHEALVGSQPEEMTLSQTVATTDGAHYTVDFWVMQDQPPILSDDFSASWNGTTLTSLVDVGQQSGYTEYQFDVTGAAGSDSSTLKFSASNEGYWDIDDVSVRQGAPTTVQQMSDATAKVSGVNATDTLTVTPAPNALGTVSATAGNGTVEWQFQATNAQLDHLMGLTQSFTVADTNNANVSQTVAVSVGGNGNDQFVFHAGVGADTMVNFSTLTTAQGAYAGDTIALEQFNGITSVADVLTHLGADSHGNAVVDLGNHDSITFQGLSVAQIQANASHIFQV